MYLYVLYWKFETENLKFNFTELDIHICICNKLMIQINKFLLIL